MLILIKASLTITFIFAGKSGVNSGIIASIFSACVILTAIMFYFKYGQKLSKNDLIGGLFIVLCVLMVSLGGAVGGDAKKTDETYLILAVVSALFAAFVSSLNTLNINFILKDIAFPTGQLNIDGNWAFGLVLLPFFITSQKSDPIPMEAIIKSNISQCLVLMSQTSFTYAVQYGSGGSVQAIENTKTLI